MEKILLFMNNPEKSEMITECLRSYYKIIHAENGISDYLENDFILLITDLNSWTSNKEILKNKKHGEEPIFLPYLLVTSFDNLKHLKNEVWEVFDEIIALPLTREVLLARIKVLLQTRNLSVQVNKLMKDKELLLMEIHHRVKNNLMVISSLLSIQSQDIEDEKTKAFFRESQNRARSMALIHERLYQSIDLKSIEIDEYISSLASDLFNAYNIDPKKVELEIDIQKIMIDINDTIPLCLIINELITNSLKYAFPGDNKGKIKIKFYKEEDYYLIVSDNGIGFPEDFNFTNHESLGVMLINNLTDQLGGKLEIDGSNGTTFCIKFPEKEYQ